MSPAVLRVLAHRAPDLVAGGPVALIDDIRKPFGGRRRSLDAAGRAVHRAHGGAVSADADAGVVITGTVAFSAFQAALTMGAGRILFAGIDLGRTAEPRFYERAGATAFSGLETARRRILANFAAGLDLARHRGVTCATLTPGSALQEIGVPFEPAPAIGRGGNPTHD